MARQFNTKANRTNLHLSAQCRQQIEEIREAAVDAGQLKPTVAAVIGEAVEVIYLQKLRSKVLASPEPASVDKIEWLKWYRREYNASLKDALAALAIKQGS